MKPNNFDPASPEWLVPLALVLALLVCPLLVLQGKAEEVSDWEGEEATLSIAVPGLEETMMDEVPDWEDDEVALLVGEPARLEIHGGFGGSAERRC